MKNFLTTFCVSLVLANSAYATGFYAGADILQANSKNVAKTYSTISDLKDGSTKKGNNLSYGVNAGFRLDILNFLAFGELFYDNLEASAKNFDSSTSQNSSVNLKNRYGAKASAGFAIFPRITPFLTYGLTNVNYGSKVLSDNKSLSKSELTPLYGLGLLVDLPFSISVKASYDYQQLNVRYAGESAKIKTNLGVAKLGLIYNF